MGRTERTAPLPLPARCLSCFSNHPITARKGQWRWESAIRSVPAPIRPAPAREAARAAPGRTGSLRWPPPRPPVRPARARGEAGRPIRPVRQAACPVPAVRRRRPQPAEIRPVSHRRRWTAGRGPGLRRRRVSHRAGLAEPPARGPSRAIGPGPTSCRSRLRPATPPGRTRSPGPPGRRADRRGRELSPDHRAARFHASASETTSRLPTASA